MDLAKIRKKSLQNLSEQVSAGRAPVVAVAAEVLQTTRIMTTGRDVISCAELIPCLPPHGERVVVNEAVTAVAPELCISPLDAILAARHSAGCDDMAALSDDGAEPAISHAALEFLCFRISDEIYGINIMDIKEITKPGSITEIPHSPPFISGVMSLRGTIIPVIDMRVRLGLSQGEYSAGERIVVIKNRNSLSGLLVDEVTQVAQVPQESVEPVPAVLDGVEHECVSGLCRSGDRLIIILSPEKCAEFEVN
jgi:purine-binding chemotaxis protein CheW